MSTQTERSTMTLWACIDCTMLKVNGEGNPEWTETEEAEHLEAMREATASFTHVSPGTFFGEGDCGHLADEYEDHAERCDRQEFTWSACDLCGSTLGGSRHAFTGWFAA